MDEAASLFDVWSNGTADPDALLDERIEAEVRLFRRWLRRTAPGKPNAFVELSADILRKRRRDELVSAINGLGVPRSLVQILQAGSKREVERIADGIVVSGYDLALLAFNARLLGYRHRFKERRFMPEHLIPAFQEIGDAISTQPRDSPLLMKALQKIPVLYRERKHLFSHLFEKGAKWHCFYFDFADWRSHGQSPHIHYIDHHWGKPLDRDVVWTALDSSDHSLPRLHIRFQELVPSSVDYVHPEVRPSSPADVVAPVGYTPKRRRSASPRTRARRP